MRQCTPLATEREALAAWEAGREEAAGASWVDAQIARLTHQLLPTLEVSELHVRVQHDTADDALVRAWCTARCAPPTCRRPRPAAPLTGCGKRQARTTGLDVTVYRPVR